MRPFYYFIISLSLTACVSTSQRPLSQINYSLEELKMAPVTTRDSSLQAETRSYLSLDLPYAPFEKIRQEIEQSQQMKLTHRGEAHITILTPPEYEKLKKKLSMKEILALTEKMELHKSPYKLLCVGKGSLKISGTEESTFYTVVESDRLFQIRKAIHVLYTSKGGGAQDFSPETFFPHVTLGFTKRDLHYEDGVIKDASTCVYSLRAMETK